MVILNFTVFSDIAHYYHKIWQVEPPIPQENLIFMFSLSVFDITKYIFMYQTQHDKKFA